jgi:pantothenate kinase-related protein Tda10
MGERDPLQRALFGQRNVDAVIRERQEFFDRLEPVYADACRDCGITEPRPEFLFDVLVPLCQFFSPRISVEGRPLLIGFGGGPGVGKTTLSGLLAHCLAGGLASRPDTLSVSLDDFYLPIQERIRRGYKWRTLPGTHDTGRLAAFVEGLDTRANALKVPRYDLGADEPLPDEVRARAPDCLCFNGAMLGTDLPGYDVLSHRLDFFIFMDAPLHRLKEWRFARERKIREDSDGRSGFSLVQMQAFWDEALAPSVTDHVLPNRERADLVIEIGPAREIIAARRQASDRAHGGLP